MEELATGTVPRRPPQAQRSPEAVASRATTMRVRPTATKAVGSDFQSRGSYTPRGAAGGHDSCPVLLRLFLSPRHVAASAAVDVATTRWAKKRQTAASERQRQ